MRLTTCLLYTSEADHASRFAELLGEVVTDSTKKNLMMRAEAECGACAGKMDLAKKAKALNLDEMCIRDRRIECPHKHYVNMTPAVAECRSRMYAELHGGKVRCV